MSTNDDKYLVLRGKNKDIYFIQKRISKDISKIIGKDFIKKSLETKDIHVARQKRDEILHELESIALNKNDEDKNRSKYSDSKDIYNVPIENDRQKKPEFSNSEKIFISSNVHTVDKTKKEPGFNNSEKIFSSKNKKYSFFSFKIPTKEELIVNIDKYIPISILILTLIVASVA